MADRLQTPPWRSIDYRCATCDAPAIRWAWGYTGRDAAVYEVATYCEEHAQEVGNQLCDRYGAACTILIQTTWRSWAYLWRWRIWLRRHMPYR